MRNSRRIISIYINIIKNLLKLFNIYSTTHFQSVCSQLESIGSVLESRQNMFAYKSYLFPSFIMSKMAQ